MQRGDSASSPVPPRVPQGPLLSAVPHRLPALPRHGALSVASAPAAPLKRGFPFARCPASQTLRASLRTRIAIAVLSGVLR